MMLNKHFGKLSAPFDKAFPTLRDRAEPPSPDRIHPNPPESTSSGLIKPRVNQNEVDKSEFVKSFLVEVKDQKVKPMLAKVSGRFLEPGCLTCAVP